MAVTRKQRKAKPAAVMPSVPPICPVCNWPMRLWSTRPQNGKWLYWCQYHSEAWVPSGQALVREAGLWP